MMDEFQYDLNTMELWELRSIQHKINREIWRRYNTDNRLDRKELIDAHNELETEIFLRMEKEDREYYS